MQDGPGLGANRGAEAIGDSEGRDGGDASVRLEAPAEVVGALVGGFRGEQGDAGSLALSGVRTEKREDRAGRRGRHIQRGRPRR